MFCPAARSDFVRRSELREPIVVPLAPSPPEEDDRDKGAVRREHQDKQERQEGDVDAEKVVHQGWPLANPVLSPLTLLGRLHGHLVDDPSGVPGHLLPVIVPVPRPVGVGGVPDVQDPVAIRALPEGAPNGGRPAVLARKPVVVQALPVASVPNVDVGDASGGVHRGVVAGGQDPLVAVHVAGEHDVHPAVAHKGLPHPPHVVALILALVRDVRVVPGGVEVDENPRGLPPVHRLQIAVQPHVLGRTGLVLMVAADVDNVGAAQVERVPHIRLPAVLVKPAAPVLAVWHVLKPVRVRPKGDPVLGVRLDLVVPRERHQGRVVQHGLEEPPPVVPPLVQVVRIAQVSHHEQGRDALILDEVVHRLHRVGGLTQVTDQRELHRLVRIPAEGGGERRHPDGAGELRRLLSALQAGLIPQRAVGRHLLDQGVVQVRGRIRSTVLVGGVRVARDLGAHEGNFLVPVLPVVHSGVVRLRRGREGDYDRPGGRGLRRERHVNLLHASIVREGLLDVLDLSRSYMT